MPTWRKLHLKATESLDLNEMPDDFTRLLWLLLPLGLDCEGRGLDNPSWVKAKLMPLRTDVSLDQIAAALECFAARGMIQRYQVDGRSYFVVPTWHKHQGDTSREAASSFPPPPGTTLPAPDGPPPMPGAAPPMPGVHTTTSATPPAAADPLMTAAPPAPDLLASFSRSDTDSESESDSDAQLDSDADSPTPPAQHPPPAGLAVSEAVDPFQLFRQSYDLPRLAPAQERTLQSLIAAYGPPLVCDAITWAVHAGIPSTRALRAITSALPGWRPTARSPARASAPRHASRPIMLDVLDQLSRERHRDHHT